jgi:hypothetical protein
VKFRHFIKNDGMMALAWKDIRVVLMLTLNTMWAHKEKKG